MAALIFRIAEILLFWLYKNKKRRPNEQKSIARIFCVQSFSEHGEINERRLEKLYRDILRPEIQEKNISDKRFRKPIQFVLRILHSKRSDKKRTRGKIRLPYRKRRMVHNERGKN
ncbi:MAG: hypothetical protein IIU02_01700 [Treponema sp.]|uniref:hypothetical protein n=1 Tax=Treponema sp. TaxID=166 RepID=UPI002580DBE4|nr:hypothetical protein [Treponema sp.]MBQ5536619.1 hypothetical protein [Treponema sp.]